MYKSDERRPLEGLGLSVYISTNLKIKARMAETLIRKGFVSVNGVVVTATRHPVYPDDVVKIKGNLV
jgi:16S rRNA U516 pseudouridylate synthase RsuA-like enzyme